MILKRLDGNVIGEGETMRLIAEANKVDLRGADLSGAYLSGADLSGAKLSWVSHHLLAHVLASAANATPGHRDTQARLMLAGYVLVTPGLCWKEYAAMPLRKGVRAWALNILRGYIVPDDGHPALLDEESAR